MKMNRIFILLISFNLINCAEVVEFDCRNCKPFFQERIIEQYDSRVDWKRVFILKRAKPSKYSSNDFSMFMADLAEKRHYNSFRKVNIDFAGFEKFRTGSADKLVTVKIRNMVDDKSSEDSFRCIYVVAQENSRFLKIKLIKLTSSAKWVRMFTYGKTECEFQCPESLVKYLCVAPYIEFFNNYSGVTTPPQKVQPLLGNQLDVIVEIEG